jgi:hypothetical protein
VEEFDLKQFVIDRYNEAEKEAHFVFDNCLILSVRLKNGYVIVEHCICRDPKKYDLEKGIELCKDKVIEHLLSIYDVVTVEDPNNFKKFPFKLKNKVR